MTIEVFYKQMDFVNFGTFSLIFQFLVRFCKYLGKKKVREKKRMKGKRKKEKERELWLKWFRKWARVRKLLGELKICYFLGRNWFRKVRWSARSLSGVKRSWLSACIVFWSDFSKRDSSCSCVFYKSDIKDRSSYHQGSILRK